MTQAKVIEPEKNIKHSLSYNSARGLWIGKYRLPNTKNWLPKWLPKSLNFNASNRLQAEHWFINWLLNPEQTAETAPKPPKTTLALLAPQWLEYRKNDRGTKLNTWKGHRTSVRTWILDNPDFPHTSIQNLDIETELKVPVILSWIASMDGKIQDKSKLQHIRCLKTMLKDCIGLELLPDDYSNVMSRGPVKNLHSTITVQSKIGNNGEDKRAIIVPVESWHALMGPAPKIKDVRKVRYLMAVLTGMRDHETEGLIWSDIHFDDEIPYIHVQRQLDKIGKAPFVDASKFSKEQLLKKQTHAITSKPKKNSGRKIPMHSLLAETLKWWKKTGWALYVGRHPVEESPVFPRNNHALKNNEAPGDFTHMDSALLLRTDLERIEKADPAITFHALRRSFSSMLKDLGYDDFFIGVLLGHKAKTVAGSNYIAANPKNQYKAIQELPVPAAVVLSGVEIRI